MNNGEGARRYGTVRSAQLGSSATLVIGPSQQRVALLFSPPTIPGTFYTVSTDPAVTLGGGINIAAGTTPVEIALSPFGDAIQKTWYGVASPGLATIGFLETIEIVIPSARDVRKRSRI